MAHPNLSPTDGELLDFLQRQTKEGQRWIARESNTGRGFRLHITTSPQGVPDVREALLLAMVQYE
jgi:hypothetical protein